MKKLKRFSAILLVTTLLLGAIPVSASARASYYLDSYAGFAYTLGGGSVSFYYDVACYDFMDEIGATQLIVQRDSGSYWVVAATYTYLNTPGLLDHNNFAYANEVIYSGTPGTRYRAVITIYAGDSSGYDYRTITTNIVTA